MLFRSRKTGKFSLFTATLLAAVFSLSIFICYADTDLSDAPVIQETTAAGSSGAAQEIGGNGSGAASEGNASGQSGSATSDAPLIGGDPVISGGSGSAGGQSSTEKKSQEISSGKSSENSTNISDAPAAIQASDGTSTGTEKTSSGSAAENASGKSSGSIISSAPFTSTSSQKTEAPQTAVTVSSDASESASGTGQEAPSSAAESGISVAGPSSGKSNAAAGSNHANDAVTRISLDFSLITPTHSKGSMNVARGAVKLDDGSWQQLDYKSNIHYAFYMLKDTKTDASGTCWYVASVKARRFGDTYADDGEMKTELWLNASDCIVRSTIDIGTTSSTRIAIVKAALACLGKQYVYGGNGPDAYDCSGLAKHIYREAGITVPRTSTQMLQMDGEISAADLRPGDLMVRSGHCGIYIGNGIFVHASDSSVGVVAEYLSVYNLSNKFTNYFNVVGD